jgi:pyruvate/2-oxoglutarate dehydrogenase complex dihydrolipoamide acyltransferase (E2) component
MAAEGDTVDVGADFYVLDTDAKAGSAPPKAAPQASTPKPAAATQAPPKPTPTETKSPAATPAPTPTPTPAA